MNKLFSQHLFFRMLFSYIVTLLIVMVVLVIGVYFFAPNAYQRHMMTEDMLNVQITPANRGEPSQTLGQRMMEGRITDNTNRINGTLPGVGYINFREAMFDSLLWAIIVAILVAIGISVYSSQRILQPLRHIDEASREIASGNYSKRIPVEGQDEFSHLARSFNAMSEKLEGIEKTRVQMIGDISHELRTPLTIIHGYLEGMADGLIPAAGDTFALMRKETERLSRLVNGLQELSRVESGAVSLTLKKVNFGEWIGELVKRSEILFEDQGLKLTLTIQPEATSAIVKMDEDRMTQIFTNLLSNARQFSPNNSVVRVNVGITERGLEARVTDQGIGIAPENLRHIFERFYQVDRSRSNTNREGSGIGLSIAHALIAAHGGEISAESEGIGHGTTFIICLPVV